MDNKIDISICMIVKNEEKYIDGCLKSMIPLIEAGAAELIIVDTGSTDNTVSICKKYTENVYFKKWNDNFSEARNYSINLAKGKYIFIQDADQEVSKSGIEELLELVRTKKYEKYNTIYLKLRNYLDEERNKYSDIKFPLIFKNDGEFRYEGAVHNQPVFKEPVLYTDIQIDHYGYAMTVKRREEKFKRTASILQKELKKDPDNIYYRFQLARSYNSVGKYEEALKEVRIYLSKIRGKNIDEESLKFYRTAAQTLYINNCYEETKEICDRVIELYPNFIDFIYMNGNTLNKLGLYSESSRVLNSYLYNLENELYLEYCDIEMFSVSSKEMVLSTINDNERKVQFQDSLNEIKASLKIMLEGDIDGAYSIISDIEKMELYNEIRDSEYFTITSLIYFYKEYYDRAIEEIEKGLRVESNSFDLNYNKAYIYELCGEYKLAYDAYYKSFEVCTDDEMKQALKGKIEEIKVKCN